MALLWSILSPRKSANLIHFFNGKHLFYSVAATSAAFIIPQKNIRNIAIIAHVDHGKTTLVDCLLRQSGTLESPTNSRLMDSNVLEKERGITILSKVTSINRGDFRINIVDTPGHADFGGEVERVLSMVDGVVLVVDATEGPMAQTKFVLSKALKKGIKPLVVFNKVDRPTARCDEVDCEVLDLFAMLNANDDQMFYPSVYASAREGWATSENPNHKTKDLPTNMDPLFDMIIKNVSPPSGNRESDFKLLVNNMENNAWVGKCFLGKIESGTAKIGTRIKAMNLEGLVTEEGRITKMFVRRGLEQVIIEEAAAGDIISVAGLSKASINFTICAPEATEPLPSTPIDPPTIAMYFSVNISPLAGREGKAVTSAMLSDRLTKEAENNVALTIGVGNVTDAFEVAGRGELQLGILIETMRREGMEFSVSPPRVVFREEKGQKLEPIEEIVVDVDTAYAGVVIEKMSQRKAELQRMNESTDKIGYASEFKNDTHGTGVFNHSFLCYEQYKGRLEFSRKGALISMADGISTAYALSELEARGTLFISPGTAVYTGMIIGECLELKL